MGKRFGPVGIIDIGSNSVRFVAYGGAARVPSALFNEKLMAGLGRGVSRDGALDEEAMDLTLEALARFRLLAREMGIRRLHTVATAAVRDARNGPAFLKQIIATGLKPRLVGGAEEAELAGLGVLSGNPRAKGIVADLGGGSLELIGVARRAVGEGITMPLGVLRVGDQPDADAIAAIVREAMKGTRLKSAAKGAGLYLVGGSFRALAQLDLRLTDHPLPIVHGHVLTAERIAALGAELQARTAEELKAATDVSSQRLPHLPAAAAVLEALIAQLEPKRVVVSAYGLREGLLYRDLPDAVKAEDPLLAAALEVGERLGRFGDHGAELNQWLDPLFPDEGPDLERLRLAACLLGDIAWNAHPDFRGERAVDMAVHGNWVGIDAHGRAMLGRALYWAFGGDGPFDERLLTLLRPGENERAEAWGRAIRLAQRVSGGTETLLHKTSIGMMNGAIVLQVAEKQRELYSDAVHRRLAQLARVMGRQARVLMV